MKKEIKNKWFILGLVGFALAGSLFTVPVPSYSAEGHEKWIEVHSFQFNTPRSASMDISANIPKPPPVCTVTAAGPVFAANGFYTGTEALFADGTIVVGCRTSTAYHVALDKGGHYDNVEGLRQVVNGPNSLFYTLYQNAAKTVQWGDSDFANTYPAGTSQAGGAGVGAPQALIVYGMLHPPVGPAVPGLYADPVLVTVHF